MAITPTGAIYKALSFDNVSSRTYGVYITGQAVYNAPTRDVEMISIPGRNGAFALDKGRFENIEVSYPAGIFADNETDFAEAISDFRNFLCSRNGYVRLSDEYNPNEYRMAIYKSGLEVSPAQLKAGEFNIVFDCKPQRWLTSGETAVTVANNGTLTNPTLFESSPMLEVEGYGIINLNEATIKISYVPLGRITLWDRRYYQITPSVEPVSYYTAFESEKVNAGDPLYYGLDTDTNSLAQLMARFYIADGYSFTETWALAGSGTLPVNTTQANVVTQQGHQRLQIFTTTAEVDFIVGTASSYSYTITYTGRIRENATQTLFASEIKFILTLTYDGSNNIQITAERQIITDEAGVIYLDIGQSIGYQIGFNRLEAGSTVLAIGNPTYIDCDLGEAYMIKDGSVISLNQYIDLGSDLPILSSGANTVTFDNTVTDLKIMPRWWKV